MKGEYVENEDENHNHSTRNPSNMFPKFSPPNPNPNPNPNLNLHQQTPKFHPPHFSHNSIPLSLKDSEEADSGPSLQTPNAASKKPKITAGEDGGTIEISRRPRGRPPGSKNRPKMPLVITREPEPCMAPYILELPGGSDIIDSLTRFTRRRGLGLCVLTASGTVSNVTLKQPSTASPGGTVTFHGRFDILSLSAVLLLNTAPFGGNDNNSNGGFAFTISLAGPQGQIVGGKVVGPLLSSGTVYVMAASFSSPTYHRLPVDDQDAQFPASNAGGGGEGQSCSPVSGVGSGGGGGGPMGLYSCHLGSASSDAIWAPTARPPPPY